LLVGDEIVTFFANTLSQARAPSSETEPTGLSSIKIEASFMSGKIKLPNANLIIAESEVKNKRLH